MISLRAALEASVNGGDETPLENEPLINAVSVDFFGEDDLARAVTLRSALESRRGEYPDAQLDPLFKAIALESRPGVALEQFNPVWFIGGMALAAAALTKLLFWFLGDGSGSKGGGGGGGALGKTEAALPQIRVKVERVDIGEQLRKASKQFKLREREEPEQKWYTELNGYDLAIIEDAGAGADIVDQMNNIHRFLSLSNNILEASKRVKWHWGDQRLDEALPEGHQRGFDGTVLDFETNMSAMAKAFNATDGTFVEKAQALSSKIGDLKGLTVSREDADKALGRFRIMTDKILDTYERLVPKYREDLARIQKELKELDDDKTYEEQRAAQNKLNKNEINEHTRDSMAKLDRLLKDGMVAVRTALMLCHHAVAVVERINRLATVRLEDDRVYIRFLEEVVKDAEADSEVKSLIKKFKD